MLPVRNRQHRHHARLLILCPGKPTSSSSRTDSPSTSNAFRTAPRAGSAAPGGLVTALEPILRRNKGAWVGWAGVADAELDPVVEDDLELYPVPLSAAEIADYYEGFSNATLWPLYHDVIVKPEYNRDWWNAYVEVNRRFAEATSKAAAHGATVWIQDYQLQLVPKMLRMLRPDLTIGFFLHIPFPPVELFMQMPWRTEIIEGLLGADLIGFHLPGGAQNFLYLARKLAGQQTSRGNVASAPSWASCRWGSARCASARFRSPSIRASWTNSPGPSRSGTAPRRSARNWAIPSTSCSASTARLHEGHRRPPRRAARTARRAAHRSRRHGDGAAGHAEPRAGRQLRADARRHRTQGVADQRRVQRGRPAGGALPAPADPPARS